jgi:hypothetical protein
VSRHKEHDAVQRRGALAISYSVELHDNTSAVITSCGYRQGTRGIRVRFQSGADRESVSRIVCPRLNEDGSAQTVRRAYSSDCD